MSDFAPAHQKSYSAQVFDEILTVRPNTPILDRVASPADLKHLSSDELIGLADELRAYLLYSTGVSGGHFGANLGVVELTIALHTVLNTPYDKLVWDVGHQAYAHKVLTGRRERLPSIRSKDGLTAFPERNESEYDTFGVGHSSTSISAALGMSLAARLLGENRKVAAVIGDGAMTGGMAFEAMNDAVQQNADLLVVLNDNDMSISAAIGGFSRHLARLWQRGLAMDIDKHGNILMVKRDISSDDRRIRHYLHMANEAFEDVSSRLPSKIGEKISGLFSGTPSSPLPDKIAEKIGDKLFADNLFKAIGFTYLGPFDGHDLPKLVSVLERASKLKGAVLVHVHTVKGKGFLPAEADPIGYHAIGKLPKTTDVAHASKPSTPPAKKYSQIFGEWLMHTAKADDKLVAITPAMAEGSGMVEYTKAFPERFFDVAIAEQHAVTLAAGMATSVLKPVVAIYSTFLQRGYDQLIHDVALQNLDVTFAIDRAGLVGEDGATHAGVFDLAYLRCVPNIIIAAPSDEHECHQLLNACYQYQGTAAVRYPRGAGIGRAVDVADTPIQIGKANIVWRSDNAESEQAQKLAVLAFGTRLADAKRAAMRLADKGVAVVVVDMRWVKPLDTALIDILIAEGVTHFATVEEHQIAGGAGSAVNEYMIAQGYPVKLKNLGITDRFIEHASHEQQLAACGLDADGIYQSLADWL
ncbi:1-deoxy-D-xylulose-5-phosphate synthase [uncultured Moraxella sp.]|uniref:1-deoxy-D-xylulose-5-phosphate synthase n=1 Tax=uncultured Moraxella sp. TaxID=263769 RepID=UPI0025EAF42B|nr:1-deoxy-D-xylulose-5-phosphate synthase [uncultured Moraxella sp.]